MRQWQRVFLGAGLFFLLLNIVRVHQQQPQFEGLFSEFESVKVNNNNDSHRRTPLPLTKSFAACMMMKEDNELLYEWVAYHYEMMPLRYLMIGSDEGNRQDPRDVLQRWNGTGLEYWVLQPNDFMHRHGKVDFRDDDEDLHHHKFMHRQRGFVTTCLEFMKSRNLTTWVLLIDSDEFLVMNRFGDKEGMEIQQQEKVTDTNLSMGYEMRKSVNSLDDGFTVMDAIERVQVDVQELSSCVLLPRLRFGALENMTCGKESEQVNTVAKNKFNFPEMSTLRYNMHGGIMNFKANKFGKVMLDLSRIPTDVIETERPNNIHRPFKQLCVRPIIPFGEAVFVLNHYTASWERYNSRVDARRSCEEWLKMAFYTADGNCEQRMHRWFPRFVKRFGVKKSQYLLGVDLKEGQTNKNNDDKLCLPNQTNEER